MTRIFLLNQVLLVICYLNSGHFPLFKTIKSLYMLIFGGNITSVLSYQGEYKAQRKAVWAIKNLTAGGTIEQIMKIVTAGALKPLCDLLVVKETEIVTMAEDTLINIHNVSRAVQQDKNSNLVILVHAFSGI